MDWDETSYLQLLRMCPYGPRTPKLDTLCQIQFWSMGVR